MSSKIKRYRICADKINRNIWKKEKVNGCWKRAKIGTANKLMNVE
jgi:hypothetical protein